MSNALAIASVTAVLKDLLNNGLIDHDVPGVVNQNVLVSALPPDRIDVTASNEESRLNLFMYRVTPNQGWRNIGLPSRGRRGERIANPPLALDLHYLLTAYGAEELHSEILLGYGMQLLHETPILPREAIRRSLAEPGSVLGTGLPDHLRSLAGSDLAEQIELVKLTPQGLTTEEISKLWAAFQARYRPTSAYQATVVMIESDRSTRSALPVRERRGYSFPFTRPLIKHVRAYQTHREPGVLEPAILAGDDLEITGENLLGQHTVIVVNGLEAAPQQDEHLTDTLIRVPVPSGLKAGVHGVQVIHQRELDSPPTRSAVASNLASFVLHPKVDDNIASVVQERVNGLCSGTLELTATPAVEAGQRVVLLLNELIPESASPPAEPASYSFSAPSTGGESPPMAGLHLTLPFARVKTGRYLVRIRVDGAESPLKFEGDRYSKPNVLIS